MIKTILKTLLLLIFFFFLTLIQMSYLPFFSFFNFIIILVLLINVLEEPDGRLGIFSAVAAGLFIDLYSSGYLGFATLALFLSSLILKFILSKYVRIPSCPWLPKI